MNKLTCLRDEKNIHKKLVEKNFKESTAYKTWLYCGPLADSL
jgi:hypothetical protein